MCAADPTDCGSDPFGGAELTDGPATAFVDAAKGSDQGSGTRGSPFKSIGKAAAKSGVALVAVAAGDYQEPIKLTQSVTIRGRCAAMVAVRANGADNAVVAGGNVAATLSRLHIKGPGNGILLQGSAQIALDRVWVQGVHGVGVAVAGANGKLTIDACVVADGAVGSGGDPTAGMLLGGKVTLRDVRVSGNSQIGITVAGGSTDAERVFIDSTVGIKADSAAGVAVLEGAQLDVRLSRVSGNAIVGVLVLGGALTATGVLIDRTVAAKGAASAQGLFAFGGAKISLTESRLTENAGTGVAVFDQGTKFAATRCLVDRGQSLPGQSGGMGVEVGDGAACELRDTRVAGNKTLGVHAAMVGTTLWADGLLVDGTEPSAATLAGGQGLAVNQGAHATLRRARLSGNRSSGALIADSGSQAWFEASAIDHTLPRQSDGLFGSGLIAQDGASVALRDVRVTANTLVGLAAFGSATRLEVSGAVVDGTLPSAGVGYGISVAKSSLLLQGSVVTGNPLIGVTVLKAAGARVVGTVVSDTLPDEKNQMGVGLFGGESTDLAIVATLLVANHSAGVDLRQTSASVFGSVIRNTLPAKYQKAVVAGRAEYVSLADGLLATGDDVVTIDRTLSVDNARAGFLVQNGHDVTLRQSVATGGFFGLAVVGASMPSPLDCWFAGTSAAVSGDQLLFVPPPPALVGLDAMANP